MQTEEFKGSDSNPYEGDSNPSSNKFPWRSGFEFLFNGFEFGFQKGSKWLLDERDLNPYSMNLNPNSNKVCLDGLIRISIQVIWIPDEERSEVESEVDSNSNPSWRTSEEIEAWIRIPYTTIQIPKSRIMKNKSMWFESSSYGSNPFPNWSWRLNVRQSDSNLWVMDSNHSLA